MSTYYSLSSILSTSHTLPSTLAFDIPHLGILDSRPGETLNANTQVSLPIYLAAFLAIQRIGNSAPLTLDLPESLSPKVLNALKADPRTVELRQLAPHYYESAERVLELFEEDEVTEVLSETFKQRAAELADMAQNVRKVSSADTFLRGLDERERELFRAAHDSAKAVRNWMGEKRS